MTTEAENAPEPAAAHPPALELTHTAFLVPNLGEAIDTYEGLFGIRFCEPHENHIARVNHYEMSEPVDFTMTYSMGDGPYIELLEATGRGLWSAERGFGLHHVGGFSADLSIASKRLEAAGLDREATLYGDDGEAIIAFFLPPAPGGARVEVLHERLRPSWTAWVHGSDALPETDPGEASR